MGEVKLMKGNEALAEAAIRAGVDAYFGYPITPQSEVIEYLSREATKRTGMLVLQAESEVAAINMIYGAAGCGKKSNDNVVESRHQFDARGLVLYCKRGVALFACKY